MPKVEFKLDIEKDLWNIWNKVNNASTYGKFNLHEDYQKICKDKKFEECKEELANHQKPLQESIHVTIIIDSLKKSWGEIETEFFKRMDNLMKKKFETNITSYATTIRICPYNPKEPSFMISIFHPLLYSLNTCGHEIMHIYFHKFYWNYCEEKIGKSNTGHLKEAITVLLNKEFKDLWFVRDQGYIEHKALRKFISQEWDKTKDFEKLLESCITYIKDNGI